MQPQKQSKILRLLCREKYRVEIIDGDIHLRGPSGELLDQGDRRASGGIQQSLSFGRDMGSDRAREKFNASLHQVSFLYGRLLALGKPLEEITEEDQTALMIPEGLQIIHVDGNFDNNHWDNLRLQRPGESQIGKKKLSRKRSQL